MAWFKRQQVPLTGQPTVQHSTANLSPGNGFGPVGFIPADGINGAPAAVKEYPDFYVTKIPMHLPGDKVYQGVQLYQAQQNTADFNPMYPAAIYTGWADRNSYQTFYTQGERIRLDQATEQGNTPNGPTILAQWADVQTVDSGGFNAWSAGQ